MRWYDRVLVSLGGLALMALGVYVALAGGGLIALPEPFALDAWLGEGWQLMPILFLAGLLLVAWGLRLFLSPLRAREQTDGNYYAVRDGDDGVYISAQALDHLTHRCLAGWDEILSAQVKIGGQQGALRITLRMTLRSDTRIPALVAQVRERIKEDVEQSAGVTVESIRVVVEATREGKTSQREAKRLAAPGPARGLSQAETCAPGGDPWSADGDGTEPSPDEETPMEEREETPCPVAEEPLVTPPPAYDFPAASRDEPADDLSREADEFPDGAEETSGEADEGAGEAGPEGAKETEEAEEAGHAY